MSPKKYWSVARTQSLHFQYTFSRLIDIYIHGNRDGAGNTEFFIENRSMLFFCKPVALTSWSQIIVSIANPSIGESKMACLGLNGV